MAERVRVSLLVSGDVQGVGFRQSAADEAARLRVTGSVRNLPDGRVELEAEGERVAVEALVAWCRRGPRFARVDDVAIAWSPPTGASGPFVVRR